MDYSIAIGIDKYSNENIKDTLYAESDAQAYKEIMERQFQLKKNDIFLGENATYENINDYFSKLSVNKGDRVFLYFAGHGSNIYSEPRLCCYNSEKEAVDKPDTWINLRKIVGFFSEKEVNLICFIDACQSAISFSARGAEEEINLIENDYVFVFSSANSEEKALSDQSLKHGIWTNFLLKALDGDVQACQDYKLTNNTLQNYLNFKVREYYKDHEIKEHQNPQAWGKFSKEFVIKDFSICNSDEKEVFISDLYFGIVDADNEMRENPEKFEDNYFDLNNVSKELFEKDNIQFVVGRKGTGKTYTGKYMELHNPQNTVYLTLDSFDYKAFNHLAKKGKGYEPFVTPWKYFILTNFLVFISKSSQNEEIEKVLTELYGRRISSQQILNKKFKKEVQINDQKIANKWMQDLAKDNNFFDLNDIIQMFLITIADVLSEKCLLILDGLDEKINENEHYKDIMNGLIWAIKAINDEMYREKVPAKVAAFFRKDVFEFVQGANTAKISVGSTLVLDWVTDSDDKKKYPLYQFMNIRYLNCLKDVGIKIDKHGLLEILPSTVKSGDGRIETWEWLLNFTTYKPRDVVQMLCECKKKCNNNEKRISEEILWEAQPEYSKYLIKELKNELYGFMDEKLIDGIFDQLHSMNMWWNEYEVIKSIINKSAVGINKPLSTEEEENIILKLYEVGVLGIMLPNGHEHWSYRRHMQIRKYITGSKYKVHQGLWKALSIW